MEKQTETKRYRFNIIDLLVILLIVALAVVLVLRGRDVKKQAAADSNASAAEVVGPPAGFDSKWNLRFEAVSDEMDLSLAQTVAEQANRANRINNSFRLLDAYVTRVEVEPTQDGKAVVRFEIVAFISAGDYYTNVDGNLNTYLGAQDIRVGKSYIVKTMTIEVNATIVAMEVRNG